MFRSIWQFCLSALAGTIAMSAVLAVISRPRSPPDAEDAHALGVRDAPTVAPPDQCPARRTALEEEAARLGRELEAVELQLRIAEYRQIDREGVEQAWPEEPDPMQVPDVLKATLEAALLETHAGELLGMDCDEFPCIVALESGHPPEVPGGASTDAFEPLFEALNATGLADHEIMWSSASGAYGTDSMVLAFAGPDRPDDKRTKFRAERYAEQIRSELAEYAEERTAFSEEDGGEERDLLREEGGG